MGLSKRPGSGSTMNLPIGIAAVALAVVLLGGEQALAQSPGPGFSFGGFTRGGNFTINNITPLPNQASPCPKVGPNKVSFFPARPNGVVVNGTVVISGQFDGAGIGVCAGGSPYSIDPSLPLTYEVWGDRFVIRIPDRVASASKVVAVRGGFAFVYDFQEFPVSILTPAPCSRAN